MQPYARTLLSSFLLIYLYLHIVGTQFLSKTYLVRMKTGRYSRESHVLSRSFVKLSKLCGSPESSTVSNTKQPVSFFLFGTKCTYLLLFSISLWYQGAPGYS